MTKISEQERILLADAIYRRFLHYIEPQFRSVKKEIEGVKSLVRQKGDFGEVPMVSQTELAEQLQIHPRTFRRWREQGLIGGAKVKGRRGLWFTAEEAQQIREMIVERNVKRYE